MKSRIKPSKILKFPAYVFFSSGREAIEANFDKLEDHSLFQNIFSLDQLQDQIEAIEYAELGLIPQDLSRMTAEALCKHIKKINQIAAKSVVIATRMEMKSGEYSQMTVGTFQETGDARYSYEKTQKYSQKNYDILTTLYGEQTADAYKRLYVKVNKFIQENKLNPETHTLSSIIKQFSMENSVEYKAFEYIYRVASLPEEIPAKMFEFSKILLDKIKNGATHIECAAFILRELIYKIHAFPNGNKRTARIFMNAIVMMLGSKAILISPDLSQSLEHAIKLSTQNDDLNPVKEILVECSKNNVYKAHFSFDLNKNIRITDKRYNIFAQQEAIEDITSITYKTCYHWLKDGTLDYYLENFPNVIVNDAQGIAITNPLVKKLEKAWVKKKIDGDTCLKLANSLLITNPKQAYYLYIRAAKFYENANKMNDANLAIKQAEEIYRAPEHDFVTEEKSEQHVVVSYPASIKANRYIDSLSEIVDREMISYTRDKLCLSLFWLQSTGQSAKLHDDKHIPAIEDLAKNLDLSRETVNALYKQASNSPIDTNTHSQQLNVPRVKC